MLQLVTQTVPEGLSEYYQDQNDGTFRLKVEGVITEAEHKAVKEKNNELRQTNINLLKTNESLSSFEKVFGTGNVSPEAINSRIESLATERAGKLSENAVKAAQDRVKELETGLSTKSQKLSKLLLGEAVQKAGTKHGVVPTAYDDVLRRAESDFEVTDDGLKFKQEKLDASGQPYTVDSWMAEQAKAAPHLFAQSQGTGASRPAKPGTGNNQQVAGRTATDMIAAGLNQNTAGNARRLN